MIRRPPRSTLSSSSAASDVYKRQEYGGSEKGAMQRVVLCLLAAPYTNAAPPPFTGWSKAWSWDTIQALSLIHISEPTRLLSISYAVFCLKKKKKRHRVRE
eukprot:TRINITY_DN19688_c0_g1_i3.p1 TRINITY_DN19688_c0_g1~~TRINITY_DN19688_c0_g1_i3.p1  ORF type:complete len:101 (+),score=29.72 TRINITY_DN19688_c0_g1_i3:138-440(+)